MNDMTLYFAVIVPLAIIILLALFLYRLFSKNMAKDELEREKLRELEELINLAEFKDAVVISVDPEPQSKTSPSYRFFNIRFEIADSSGELKIFSARWNVDTYYLPQIQPGSKIRVKVYTDKVFPLTENSRLYPAG